MKALARIRKHKGLSLIGLVFGTLLFAYFFVTPQVTGDEPHYLIVDRAISYYHTLDLKAAYLDGDYLRYYPAPGLLPQGDPSLISINDEHVYSMHGIGLPVFLLPGFILGSKTGAVVQMIMLATAVIAMTWVWCRRVTKDETAAYIATGLLLVSYFFVGLSGYLYPDMVIAAATLACLLILGLPTYASARWQTAIGLILGFLIFVHYRNVDIALPVLAVLTYKTWKASRQIPWIAYGITSACLVLFMATQIAWFGTIDPSAPYGDLTTISHQPWMNVLAMLFDSSRGLLIYNPILLLLAVGLPIWYKLHRRTLVLAVIITGPSMLALSLFNQWTGGAAPVGRYIVAFLHVFIPALALVVKHCKTRWQRGVIIALGVATLLITLDAVLNKFTFIAYASYRGISPLVMQLQHYLGLNIEHFIPTYTNNTQLIGSLGWIKLLAWVMLLGALAVYGWHVARSIPTSRKAKN